MSEIESPSAPASTVAELAEPTPSGKYTHLADSAQVALAVRNLEANGFRTIVVSSGDEARAAVRDLLPEGAEVFNSTSVTLDETGIASLIEDSGRYRATRPALLQLRTEGKKAEQRRLGSAPDYVVGSVHAITEKGQVVVASGSGSQLAPYVFGANHVIWVVGTQKIVSDLDAAFDRIYSYTLPRESERVRKAYGMPGSFVSKLLIVNREGEPGRTTIVLVNQVLGF
jgi:acyl-CoA hydrolase